MQMQKCLSREREREEGQEERERERMGRKRERERRGRKREREGRRERGEREGEKGGKKGERARALVIYLPSYVIIFSLFPPFMC